ncbi:MAG: thioredoxin family protein [Marmoricola sp.]
MDTGAWVLVIAVLGALGFGLWRAVRDGRFRGTHQVKGADVLPTAATQPEGALAEVVDTLGERATLVQFSSAFCAPCRAARVVLSDVAAAVPGVRHVEIDAEHHLDVVRRLGVQRTPTTLLLDAHGREISRALGAPRKQAVLASLSAMGINI